MRTFKTGLALAILGSVLLAPLAAAGRRQDGIISGSAAAEAKQPYTKYVVRARDVSNNQITQTTTLDANGLYALNGLAAGSFIVELVRDASANGQGGKVVCQEGPFTLQTSAAATSDTMTIKGADIVCNRPVAAYWLLGAAAAAGVTAGIIAVGNPSGSQ
jgi:hypothetical protein